GTVSNVGAVLPVCQGPGQTWRSAPTFSSPSERARGTTMSALLECPEMESWQSLLSTTLLPADADRYERHLMSCATCRGRLDREEGWDPLLRLARQVGDPTTAPHDPTLAAVLRRLCQVKSLLQGDPQEVPDLFFLPPSDRRELLGTLGQYEVMEVIGQGGMGVVLKAYEPALHRLVAIKVLAPGLAGSALARRRFI